MKFTHIYLPKVLVFQSDHEVDQAAAETVVSQIVNKPNSILTLATGSTPMGLYQILVEKHHHGLDFGSLTTRNLDEYIGLSPDHPESYLSFMQRNLFNHINIPHANIHIPNGLASDPKNEADRYAKLLADQGPADLTILGIGPGSHIAFNFPGTNKDALTHVVNLDEQTIIANSRFFKSRDDVPRQAITMGIAEILESKRIILIAKGLNKAIDIQLSLKEEIGPEVPASFLRLHPDVTFILDKEAASLL